ncbi:MAG: ATP-dependent DNA helicase RecG [Acholeplasmataceae bacterium]
MARQKVGLDTIRGIGPKTYAAFLKAGIASTDDLLKRRPSSYENYALSSLDEARDRERITLSLVVSSRPERNPYQRISRIRFDAAIDGKKIEVVVFGRGYLVHTLRIGARIVVKGTYHLYQRRLFADRIIMGTSTEPLQAVYRIEGVSDRLISKFIGTIIETDAFDGRETIPDEYLEAYRMPGKKLAYRMLHLPRSIKDVEQAERRFKYEEAFYLHLGLAQRLERIERPPKTYAIERVKQKIAALPFTLTADQKEAVNDIFRDFKRREASFRLIQGDVGSGKTIVAGIALYAIFTAGEQVAFMAPTELLAIQHAAFFEKHFPELRIALLIGKTKDKVALKEAIERHGYDLVIGTHALIEEDVRFPKLGLVIIDEQHKFGVKTRQELEAKARTKDVLYLTATPIPRTLRMVAFGEANVSSIKEKPLSRRKIRTFYLTPDRIERLYEAIERTLAHREHVYLVVPAISSDHVADNIETVYDRIKDRFAPIFILHGQLSESERNTSMQLFLKTPGSILLATTMVEVGIDVPTATLMAVFSAEHFGLSQLHQLRGRIGRSERPSSCYLVSTKDDVERLELLTRIDDGFALSAYDLKARGPGDFFGKRQSGYLNFTYLDLVHDYPIMVEAQKNVKRLLARTDFKDNPAYEHYRRYIRTTKKV